VSNATASPSLNCAALAEQLLEQYQKDKPAEPAPVAAGQESRKSERRTFSCWQLVAEYDGFSFPLQEDFQLRLCQDISAGGISFLSDERPRTEDLIIALGPIPFIFFHVRFAQAIRRKDLEGHPFMIGCRFVKRLMG
jgi:hypothetical protein